MSGTIFYSFSPINLSDLDLSSLPKPLEINQKVRLNDKLRREFPNSFEFDVIYQVMESKWLDNSQTYSYKIFGGEPEKIYTLHESFLDVVGSPKKCECDLADLMCRGCRCGGKILYD